MENTQSGSGEPEAQAAWDAVDGTTGLASATRLEIVALTG
jgi:hypothetical protein